MLSLFSWLVGWVTLNPKPSGTKKLLLGQDSNQKGAELAKKQAPPELEWNGAYVPSHIGLIVVGQCFFAFIVFIIIITIINYYYYYSVSKTCFVC